MHIFFYGLFMDRTLLTGKGLTPSLPIQAHLEGYALKIGNRASLAPQIGSRAYGVVMELGDAEASDLYAEPSVADYQPETVQVTTAQGENMTVICYNLPTQLLTGTNAEYAKKLLDLGRTFQFPEPYLAEIEAYI